MSTNNRKHIRAILKEFDSTQPFNKRLFQPIALILAIVPLVIHFRNIKKITSTEDILKHLFVIGFILLLSILSSLLLSLLINVLLNLLHPKRKILECLLSIALLVITLFLCHCFIYSNLPTIEQNNTSQTTTPSINIHIHNKLDNTLQPAPEPPLPETDTCTLE